jgi:hypothetical protein
MPLQAPERLVALDFDASRVRAAVGGRAGPAEPLPLEGESLDLPMAISLEGRALQVGATGARLLRRMPHLSCHDFLACLGSTRQWAGGRHRLHASDAIQHVFKHLEPVWTAATGVGIALPSYMEAEQAIAVCELARESGMRVAGAVSAALPLAQAAYMQAAWSGPGLVVEIDDHALTWTAVAAEDGEIRRLGSHVVPQLRHTAWKEKLLCWVAENCIRQSRTDPRAYPEIDQLLFDQLGRVLATQPEGQILELVIQREQWYHNILLRFEELARVCAPYAVQVVKAMDELMAAIDPPGVPAAIIASWPASRLPGLVAALEMHWERKRLAHCAVADPRDEVEPDHRPLNVLPAFAVAERVFALTVDWCGKGNEETVDEIVDHVPAPVTQPPTEAPARLAFRLT